MTGLLTKYIKRVYGLYRFRVDTNSIRVMQGFMDKGAACSVSVPGFTHAVHAPSRSKNPSQTMVQGAYC